MSKVKPGLIKEVIYKDVRYHLEGFISSTIDYLKAIEAKHPNAEMSFYAYNDYGTTVVEAEVYFYRDETPEEIAAKEAANKEARQRRFEQYQRLRQEFDLTII